MNARKTIQAILIVILVATAYAAGMLRVEQETIEPTMCPTNAELIDNLRAERTDAQTQVEILKHNLLQVQKNNTEFADRRGSYHPGTGLIKIETAQATTYEAALYAFNHEYAHKVWFEELSEEERQYWETKFKVTEDFPTAYAETNAAEYYAEVQANNWTN